MSVRGNPWYRIAMTAMTVVIVLLLAESWRFLDSHGVFTSAKPGFAGTCRTITGVEGVGDIAVDTADGLAFVSASTRVPSAQDGIYALAYSKSDARLEKLSGAPHDFHPSAISLVRASDGRIALMAINHRSEGAVAISVFKATSTKLEEIGAMTSDSLVDPSDLVAQDDIRFYVINRHTSRTKLGRWLDDALVLPRANVLYFDGIKFVPVIDRLIDPAGIALSADGAHVYVSENLGHTLLAFERNPFNGQLSNAGSLAIPSGLEKLSVATDGNLFAAAQPKVFAVGSFRRDPSRPAPSQVFHVALSNGIPKSAALVYSNEGMEISASSTAVMAGGHLLVGSALDRKLLDCSLR
jgi:arylesterase/paraoxonase